MRAIPPALQARLDSGCTTLATCWILTRRDDVRLGFTEHDRDLTVDGVTCRAASGFDGAASAEKLGFAVGAGEVAGALVDEAIAEDEVTAGLYDGARVEVHLADWSEPGLSVLLRVMTIGEITREGPAFRAELRALTAALDVEQGRLYTPRCSADLGDARCGLELEAEALAVVSSGPDGIVCAGSPEAAGLIGGRFAVTSGPSAGFATEIAAASPHPDGIRIVPWQAPPGGIAPGDTVTASPGCDKSFATCRDRFGNAANFRGFPHMPGIDRVAEVPVAGEGVHDGTIVTR